MTTSRSRGISTEMLRRLWTRAPCTAIVVRTGGVALEGIGRLRQVHERQLLHRHVAAACQLQRHRRLADHSLLRQVLAGGDDAADVERLLEMILELAAAARLRDFLQMIDDRREERR